jgi:hypothetical protein
MTALLCMGESSLNQLQAGKGFVRQSMDDRSESLPLLAGIRLAASNIFSARTG